ncbi:hypothetical protein [Actinomadura macrotermitis]|uniref:Uncharacterized protein n=1 Tax=Actinomadura macrotermitis TaxID=2585200 RepID=A0A7K0C855_9ACTN|nr:hypothetical protein [Actinomadura macrotermitis]MQY09615.1 hypothetical protein [Actinomadura macrotermitis]
MFSSGMIGWKALPYVRRLVPFSPALRAWERPLNVIERFLDRQLAEDAKYGGRMDLDECPPLPRALGCHLRACARSSTAWARAGREIRVCCAQRPVFLRLMAYVYAGMSGYRPAWRPDFAGGPAPADPVVDLLLERWRDQERLAREAAEEAGLDFAWREVERQDGQGLVIDGAGRPLWETAVYPEDGFAISRYGPGRVLRELAVRREMLAGLDLSAENDQVVLRLLAEPSEARGAR